MKKTRGFQEPVITHLVFNLTSKFNRKNQLILFFPFEISHYSHGSHLGWNMKGGNVTHIFESGLIKDHFSSSF